MLVAAVRYREIIRNAQHQAMNSLGVPICSTCGYLLKGERREPICPECGAVILSPEKS
jgi:rubrerythrin